MKSSVITVSTSTCCELLPASGDQIVALNLGTGRGYSVLEVVRAYEQASGRRIAIEVVARRPGDVDASYADVSLARDTIGWQARRGLDAMCADSWRWQHLNPNGFAR